MPFQFEPIPKEIQERLIQKQDALMRQKPYDQATNPQANDPTSGDAVTEMLSRSTFLRMSAIFNDGSETQFRTLSSTDISGDTTTIPAGINSELNSPKDPKKLYNFDSELRLVPGPGITSCTAQYKTFFMREASVEWKCWSIDQIDELTKFFLTPGRICLVEWGWSRSVSQFDLDTINANNLNDAFSSLRDRIVKNKGDYDAVIGKIKNFNWDLQNDGSFNCTTDVIAMGSDILNEKVPDAPEFPIQIKIPNDDEKAKQFSEKSNIRDILKKSNYNFNVFIKNLDEQLKYMFVSGKEKFKNFYWHPADGRAILGNPQGSSGNKNWTEVGPYVTWGWMEDNIINKFFSKIGKDGELLSQIRSVERSVISDIESQLVSTQFLSSKYLLTFSADSVILPGRFQAPTVNDLLTRGEIESAEEFEQNRDAVRKLNGWIELEKQINDRFENIQGGGNQPLLPDNRGYIRNICLHYSIIQEAFTEINDLINGFKNLFGIIQRELIPIMDLDVRLEEDNQGRIVCYDKNAQRKKIDDFEDKKSDQTGYESDGVFVFPTFAPNSIVKNQSLKTNITPQAVSAMTLGAQSDPNEYAGGIPQITEQTDAYALAQLFNSKFVPVGEEKEKQELQDALLFGISTPDSTGTFGNKTASSNQEDIGNGKGFPIDVEKVVKQTNEDLESSIERRSIKNKKTLQLKSDEYIKIVEINATEKDAGIMWDLNGDLISEYAKSVEYFLINHPQGVFKQDRDPIVPLSISLEIDGTGGLYPGVLFTTNYLPRVYAENCFFIASSVSTAVDSSTWTTSIEGMMSINQRKRQEQRIINLDSVSTTGREAQKVWSTLSTSEALIEVSEAQ